MTVPPVTVAQLALLVVQVTSGKVALAGKHVALKVSCEPTRNVAAALFNVTEVTLIPDCPVAGGMLNGLEPSLFFAMTQK